MAVIFLAFLCAHLSTISMVEASNSNCPKVAFIGDFHVVGSGIRNSTCKGTMLRASTWSKISNSYIPGTPDINGRGKHRTSNKADIYFSKRTSFHLYKHSVLSNATIVSIRWARNPQYALADENGQLQFSIVKDTQSATPPAKFLFRLPEFDDYSRSTFQNKKSGHFISIAENDCSVALMDGTTQINFRWFFIKCKPKDRCFCY